VRAVKTVVTLIDLAALHVAASKVQELTSVESSLRVDAIASVGFRISRTKMAALVKAGDVRVNWLPCSKPSVEVQVGDVVACVGKGRLKVQTVGQTKKGKFSVQLVRFT
jgi:RNA-binding protein YlmH